jgi:hypothetical protein
MALTFNSFVSEIATLTVISSTVLVSGDSNFAGIMAGIIDYAEGRLWRELDLPVVSVVDTSITCSSGVNLVALSSAQGEPLVIQALNLLTPAGATSSNATRVPLVPSSRSVIDAIYPSAASSNCGQPEFFYRINNNQVLLGPAPDQAYGTELTVTIRPAPLSASNSSTWLTQNLPELMIAAGMIFASGYMRNFGAQADDPKMAASWEGQYANLMKSANVDAMRMQFESQGWTSQSPAPLPSPPRS